jgi:hypothetical protein
MVCCLKFTTNIWISGSQSTVAEVSVSKVRAGIVGLFVSDRTISLRLHHIQIYKRLHNILNVSRILQPTRVNSGPELHIVYIRQAAKSRRKGN